MPTKSDEMTSLTISAITMATNGGNIDIHRGIGEATGPFRYNQTKSAAKVNSSVSTGHFFFIST